MKQTVTDCQEFYRRSRLLGHDPALLAAGREIVSYFTLPSLAAGRQMLSVATPAQRRLRQQTFYNPPVALRSRLGQGRHDRGEAFAFAAGQLEERDYLGISHHLPLHVKAVSVLTKRVAAGEIWDVSVRGAIWAIDDLEELYTTVNIGTLILEPGAKLIVRGNVFSLVCQQLISHGDHANPNDYQIGILPTPFSVDLRSGPIDGLPGSEGQAATRAMDGRIVQVENSILGFRATRPVIATDLHGQNGGQGEAGGAGTSGRNGGMCKLAEITLRTLEGSLTVFAQAGAGGRGGDGGSGGAGGDGGSGSRGYRLFTGTLAGGDGGSGGPGGDGGKGGDGGHGGIASNIYVNVPPEQVGRVRCRSIPSRGGLAGTGGRAGAGGQGGQPGAGPQPGRAGLAGRDGMPGQPGRPGRKRPAAWMFLNECVRAGQTHVPDLSPRKKEAYHEKT